MAQMTEIYLKVRCIIETPPGHRQYGIKVIKTQKEYQDRVGNLQKTVRSY